MTRVKKLLPTQFEVCFIILLTSAAALPWWFGEEPFKYSLLYTTLVSIAGAAVLLAMTGIISWFLDKDSGGVGSGRVALRPLVKFTDWIPTKKLRQRIQTLIAEDQSDIRRLRKSHRTNTARWRELCTWLIVVWYVIFAPLVWLKALFVAASTLF